MFKGNILQPHIYSKILEAQEILDIFKYYKLVLRQNKYSNDIWQTSDIVRHLFTEYLEFEHERLVTNNYDAMLKELADISNCIDILAMLVINKEPMK